MLISLHVETAFRNLALEITCADSGRSRGYAPRISHFPLADYSEADLQCASNRTTGDGARHLIHNKCGRLRLRRELRSAMSSFFIRSTACIGFECLTLRPAHSRHSASTSALNLSAKSVWTIDDRQLKLSRAPGPQDPLKTPGRVPRLRLSGCYRLSPPQKTVT